MPTDSTSRQWESTAVVVHEWTGDAPLEQSIVEAIADLSSSGPPRRPSATESERVRAVDRLFSEVRLVGGELELRYADCDVTVKGNGVVRVEGPSSAP
jgi:hypothetical protein